MFSFLIRAGKAEGPVSRNQKAPLFAFVLVAMVCGLILVDSIRGNAFPERLSLLSPPVSSHSANDHQSDLPPAFEQGEAGAVTSPDELPYPFGPTSLEAPATDPDGDAGSGDTSNSSGGGGSPGFGSHAAGPPASPPENGPAQDSEAPATGSENPGGADGTGDQGNTPGEPFESVLGTKDATAGIANFGPDGGRPEIDPQHPEPLDEPGAGTDGADPGVMAEPDSDSAEPTEPTEPTDPLGPPPAVTGP
jgi:hypothetical protein